VVAVRTCLRASTVRRASARLKNQYRSTHSSRNRLRDFEEGVLHRLSRLDEAQADRSLVSTLVNRLSCQLRSVIQNDCPWSAARERQAFEHLLHGPPGSDAPISIASTARVKTSTTAMS
jgi:hypothetical protein